MQLFRAWGITVRWGCCCDVQYTKQSARGGSHSNATHENRGKRWRAATKYAARNSKSGVCRNAPRRPAALPSRGGPIVTGSTTSRRDTYHRTTLGKRKTNSKFAVLSTTRRPTAKTRQRRKSSTAYRTFSSVVPSSRHVPVERHLLGLLGSTAQRRRQSLRWTRHKIEPYALSNLESSSEEPGITVTTQYK